MTKRILYVHRGSEAAPPPFSSMLADGTVETSAIAYEAKAKGLPAVFAIPRLTHYDAIVASEYYLVWAFALRLSLTGGQTRLIALGFNQSGRLLLSGRRSIDRLLNRIWSRVALFIIHSRTEAALFAAAHDIPAARFAFAHWGYDLPVFKHGIFSPPYRQYVCMVGRNNRDIELFFEALKRANTAGVLVTSAYMMTPALIAAQQSMVTVLLDVSMDMCLDVVRQSVAHLVLVKDDKRGAGHISAVSAMLLEKPQIFSDVSTLDDYLIDGFNGIRVPMNDAAATAAAIKTLVADDALAQLLGKNGSAFAKEWLSNEKTAILVGDIVRSAINGDALPADGWAEKREHLIDTSARSNPS